MKLSEVDLNKLLAASPKEKIKFIFNGIEDKGESCEYALLLGAPLDEAERRASYAARLYNEGRVRYIIPSGGVVRQKDGADVTECDFMSMILKQHGVPVTAIIPDNNALTTRENMIFGALMLNRATKLVGIDKIMVITSAWHIRRSLALAKSFLPRKIRPIGAPVPLPCDAEQWIAAEENLRLVDDEIRFTKNLADNGIIEDMRVF